MADGFSPTALAGFELLFRPWLHRRIRPLIGEVPKIDENLPVVFVSNHTSWWDPFLIRELHRRMRPGAPIYTVMLEAELARRPFFRRIGAIGIRRTSPSSIRASLRVLGGRIHGDPRSSLIFFPQGRIWPSRRRPLGFQRGIDLFLGEIAPATVVPVAIHVEPLNHPSPVAFVLPGLPLPATGETPLRDRLEEEVGALLAHIEQWVDRHGEAAPQNWPPSAVAALTD